MSTALGLVLLAIFLSELLIVALLFFYVTETSEGIIVLLSAALTFCVVTTLDVYTNKWLTKDLHRLIPDTLSDFFSKEYWAVPMQTTISGITICTLFILLYCFLLPTRVEYEKTKKVKQEKKLKETGEE